MGDKGKIGDAKLADEFMRSAARMDNDELDRLCRKAGMNGEQCRLAQVGAQVAPKEHFCSDRRFSAEERDLFVASGLSEEFIERLDTSCALMERAKWFAETFDDRTEKGKLSFMGEIERYDIFFDGLVPKLLSLAADVTARELQLRAMSLLVRYLDRIKDPSLKSRAASVVSAFKQKELPTLAERLREKSIDIKDAVIIFGDIGREDSVPYIVELMRCPPNGLIIYADRMADFFRNMQADGLRLLVRLIRDNDSPDSVKLAFLMLASLATRYKGETSAVGPVLQDLLDICFSGGELVIMEANAITALASIDPRPLIETIRVSNDKRDAVEMLAQTDPPKDREMNVVFFDALKKLSLSDNPYVRGMAFRGLAKLPSGSHELVESAVMGLLSDNGDLKRGAMVYLMSRGGFAKDAIPFLEMIIGDLSQIDMHKLAGEAMDRIVNEVK